MWPDPVGEEGEGAVVVVVELSLLTVVVVGRFLQLAVPVAVLEVSAVWDH